MPARACAIVFVFLLSAGMHAAPVQAAGDVSGLSTQIKGIVSSALGATAAQPLSEGSATKTEDAANEAIALAENVAADAISTASQSSPAAAAVLGPESGTPEAAPSGTERSAPARSRPARPHRAGREARRHAALPAPETRVAPVVKVASTRAWSVSRTAANAERPQRSAAPEWPRPPAPAPPRPDAAAAGQSGGQSTPVPSLLAALAALFLIFGFQFLSRALPKSAFRKPRRIALPSWHPG